LAGEVGYFADGLTDEIINALAQLPELLVTARTSAFFVKTRTCRPFRKSANCSASPKNVGGDVVE